MSADSTIDGFVKDPSLMVELCREVIDRLDSYTEATDIHEQQTLRNDSPRGIWELPEDKA
ncbi:MAG: hypothetical protein JZU52_10215 [Lamprocystis purpurea]|jgi:hypothetical protein|uniref:hypothetical protein n=1 Tax=Lamprocystis purpurea TaxID=61598 RepID=UPI000362FD60|nr:hypothetical protein [Lamprocystis purpurea]MBV5273991.1 hypothetical protein [Lamprocystis purpurea]